MSWRSLVIAGMAALLLVSALWAGMGSGQVGQASASATQPDFPIRAAFYYGWFPQGWNQLGINPYTKYHPTLGYYDTTNLATVRSQVAAMLYGKVQVGIASWWGVGHYTDTNMTTLLRAADGTPFRWAVYYEAESQGDPSVSQIRSDLTYLRNKYANDPNYLQIGGRFVVFVYADGNDDCAMADRWRQANTVNAYIVLKVFSGYQSCASQPNSWHQYGPASAADSQGAYSYTISPGFDKVGESTRLVRDLTRWNKNVRDMVASGARFQLVTSFNEWGEGTGVESAAEWASSSGYGSYLDALHFDGQAQLTSPIQPPAPTATNSPAPSSTAPPAATATSAAPKATSTATATVAAPTATATQKAAPTATPVPPKPTPAPPVRWQPIFVWFHAVI